MRYIAKPATDPRLLDAGLVHVVEKQHGDGKIEIESAFRWDGAAEQRAKRLQDELESRLIVSVDVINKSAAEVTELYHVAGCLPSAEGLDDAENLIQVSWAFRNESDQYALFATLYDLGYGPSRYDNGSCESL